MPLYPTHAALASMKTTTRVSRVPAKDLLVPLQPQQHPRVYFEGLHRVVFCACSIQANYGWKQEKAPGGSGGATRRVAAHGCLALCIGEHCSAGNMPANRWGR